MDSAALEKSDIASCLGAIFGDKCVSFSLAIYNQPDLVWTGQLHQSPALVPTSDPSAKITFTLREEGEMEDPEGLFSSHDLYCYGRRCFMSQDCCYSEYQFSGHYVTLMEKLHKLADETYDRNFHIELEKTLTS